MQNVLHADYINLCNINVNFALVNAYESRAWPVLCLLLAY